jgi:hypothetical protein
LINIFLPKPWGLAVKITFAGKNISKIEKLKTTIDKQFRVSID